VAEGEEWVQVVMGGVCEVSAEFIVDVFVMLGEEV
jgi:hypothetical protein